MEAKEVFNNLVNNYDENKFAHAFLFETNNIDMCYQDVIKLIKTISCSQKYNEECTKCNVCHLIDTESLPSLIIIKPIDNAIKKDLIDNLKKCFSMVPVYTKNNMYIIVSPEKMNNYAYNKMLKFLEEPEDNIIGFYITENCDKVPSTILSRLEKVKINYTNGSDQNSDLNLSEEEKSKIEKEANDYLLFLKSKTILSKDIIFSLEKTIKSKNELLYFLKIIYNNIFDYLKKESVDSKKTTWLQLLKICTEYLEKNSFNGNINLLINSFIIEIGEVYGK